MEFSLRNAASEHIKTDRLYIGFREVTCQSSK